MDLYPHIATYSVQKQVEIMYQEMTKMYNQIIQNEMQIMNNQQYIIQMLQSKEK